MQCKIPIHNEEALQSALDEVQVSSSNFLCLSVAEVLKEIAKAERAFVDLRLPAEGGKWRGLGCTIEIWARFKCRRKAWGAHSRATRLTAIRTHNFWSVTSIGRYPLPASGETRLHWSDNVKEFLARQIEDGMLLHSGNANINTYWKLPPKIATFVQEEASLLAAKGDEGVQYLLENLVYGTVLKPVDEESANMNIAGFKSIEKFVGERLEKNEYVWGTREKSQKRDTAILLSCSRFQRLLEHHKNKVMKKNGKGR